MTWSSSHNTAVEDVPRDIVEELLYEDQKLKRSFEGAMVMDNFSQRNSIYLRAAQEIERLRRIAGMVNN